MKFVRMQDKEWFNENAYCDELTRMWPSKEKQTLWEETTVNINQQEIWIDTWDFSEIIDLDSIPLTGENMLWGVKEYLPKEKYPELYL